jgi:hypothetical protein
MSHTSPIASVLATVFLAGCASVSTGIVADDAPNTYSVTERQSPLDGGAASASEVAMTEARQYCTAQGRHFVPVRSNYVGHAVQQAIVGPTGLALTFRCASPNDPDDALSAAIPPP